MNKTFLLTFTLFFAIIAKLSAQECNTIICIEEDNITFGKTAYNHRSIKEMPMANPMIAPPKSGLYAGEVNDFNKWSLWNEITEKTHAGFVPMWKIKPHERYMVQVVDKKNIPVTNAIIKLLDRDDNIIWETKSDNTGKAELWANIFNEEKNAGNYKIECEYNGITNTIKKAQPFENKINKIKIDLAKEQDCKTADIMFLVDATASMKDRVFYLQNKIPDIVERIKKEHSLLNINIGSVFYRDMRDEYVTRVLPLNSNLEMNISFIKAQHAAGGGYMPKALDIALFEAVENGGWHDEALTRIAFILLDAPCNTTPRCIKTMHQQIALAAQKGIRLVPIISSEMEQDGEYLMRAMSLATNGTNLLLTEGTDSDNIGNMEMLDNMIIQIINQYTEIPH